MPTTYSRPLESLPLCFAPISACASSDGERLSTFYTESAVDLSVITLLFILGVAFGPLFGDFQHHLTYNPSDMLYPPLLGVLRDAIPLPAFYSITALNLLFAVLLPWACIRSRFGRNAGQLYLYASMIPVLAMTIWLVPQMIIQFYMLAPLVHPAFALLWILGPYTHSFWWGGLVLWAVGLGVARHKGIL
jgi:hypothetical protein